jgi:thiosulfate reductase cytochrome b subunit
MTASTERRILRWVHMILSVPILGFLYGPVADNPRAAFATRYVFLPTVVLTGLWMWKGHAVRRRFFGLARPRAALGAGVRRDR